MAGNSSLVFAKEKEIGFHFILIFEGEKSLEDTSYYCGERGSFADFIKLSDEERGSFI